MLLLVINVVSALNVVEDSVELKVEYQDFDDDQYEDYVIGQTSFTVDNSNANEITIIVSASGLPSTNYVAEGKEVVITANSTPTVSYTIKVPHDKDAGTDDIGTLKIEEKGNTGNTDTATLIQNTSMMLELDRLEVDYTSEDGSESDKFNGDDDDSWELDQPVLAGEEITLVFKYNNLFEDKYRYSTFDDITLTIDDRDSLNDDIDDSWDLDSLDGDSDDTFEISFTPDEDIDEGNYDLDITLEARDEENAEYKIEKTLTIEIDRLRDDLRISQSEFSPETITMCDKDAYLTIEIKNYGTDDQKYAAVSVYNKELKINENIKNFAISEFSDNDNTWKKTFTFPLEEVKEGKYDFDINAYVDLDENADYKRITLNVEKCQEEKLTVENTEEDTKVIVTTLDTNKEETSLNGSEQLSSSTVVSTTESSYSSEDFLVGAIIIAIILIVALIIVFFVILLK
jgi:hypothetical protein